LERKEGRIIYSSFLFFFGSGKMIERKNPFKYIKKKLIELKIHKENHDKIFKEEVEK